MLPNFVTYTCLNVFVLTQLFSEVRRNLFGEVDHEALSADLDAKLAELSAEKKREWNFDFCTGEPVEGAIEWRTVSDETTPPKGVCSKLEDTTAPIKFNTKVQF